MPNHHRLLWLVFSSLLVSSSAIRTRGPKGGVRNNNDNAAKPQQPRRILKEDKKKGPKERECKISEKRNEMTFKCKTKTDKKDVGTAEIKDAIEFGVRTQLDGLKVNVKYMQNITEDPANQTETQYELTFGSLIEYEKAVSKNNTDEAYNWEMDKVVQEIDLSAWNDFSSISNDTENIASTFKVTTPDDSVIFTFTISRGDKGEKLTANKMKIDFELLNFPWKSTDTYVALITSVGSKRTIEGPQAKSGIKDVKISFEDAVDTVDFVPVGEYTWDTTANSTNAMTGESTHISVVATSPTSQGDLELIAFSFVGDAAKSSKDIYWDPEAGVGYSGSYRACLSLAGAAVALFALV